MVGEVSRCLLPPFLRSCPSSCPFLSLVGAFCCPLLPAASLMLKCKKCPKMLRSIPQLCFKGRRHLRLWGLKFPVAPGRVTWHLFPSCPFSGQRWGVEEPADGRRVGVPCMKCGCSCSAPGPSPLQLDSSLPMSQTLLLPHTRSFIPCTSISELWLLWLALACQCVIALRPIELTL